MKAKDVALNDMRACGLNVTFFLYDIWFGDGRKYNGGNHTKSNKKQTAKVSAESET